MGGGLRSFFLPLFTERRGRYVLGSVAMRTASMVRIGKGSPLELSGGRNEEIDMTLYMTHGPLLALSRCKRKRVSFTQEGSPK
jgi:hypothetical protein